MSADHQNDPIPQVLIEIQAGKGLSLASAVRPLPAHRGVGSVNPNTAFRWVSKGAKTANGRVVKLEAARVGGRWITTPEAEQTREFTVSVEQRNRPATTAEIPVERFVSLDWVV